MTAADAVRAYRACFLAAVPAPRPRWAFWRRRKAKPSPPGVLVLRDLARICYANKTTATGNPTAMAVAEGRRQVLLHVQRMLALTDDDIHRIAVDQEPLL